MESVVVRRRMGDALHALLRPMGFSKKAQLFSRPLNDVVQLVQLQGSASSTAADVRCTVNVAVWVPELAADATASVEGAHWRQRIGNLGPEHSDFWWHIHDEQSLHEACVDLLRRVEAHALPALALMASSGALLVLWKSGRSPGLTAVQAARYAEVLDRARPRP